MPVARLCREREFGSLPFYYSFCIPTSVSSRVHVTGKRRPSHNSVKGPDCFKWFPIEVALASPPVASHPAQKTSADLLSLPLASSRNFSSRPATSAAPTQGGRHPVVLRRCPRHSSRNLQLRRATSLLPTPRQRHPRLCPLPRMETASTVPLEAWSPHHRYGSIFSLLISPKVLMISQPALPLRIYVQSCLISILARTVSALCN